MFMYLMYLLKNKTLELELHVNTMTDMSVIIQKPKTCGQTDIQTDGRMIKTGYSNERYGIFM